MLAVEFGQLYLPHGLGKELDYMREILQILYFLEELLELPYS
jgi:hypothetical protein